MLKKVNRHPNRYMNRVFIGLFSQRLLNIRGRKVHKGAKGILGLFANVNCRGTRTMPLYNMMIEPNGRVEFYETSDTWTWEIPYTDYPVIVESNE